MDISSGLWQAIHGSVTLDQVKPAGPYLSTEHKLMLRKHGIDLRHIKCITAPTLNPFVWFKDGCVIDIHFHHEILPGIAHRIAQFDQERTKLIEKGKWESYFGYVDKRFIIPTFIAKLKLIPEKKAYDVFTSIWDRAETGFELFNERTLRKIFKLRKHSKEWAKRMDQFRADTADQLAHTGMILCYHGEQNREYNPGDQCSWTLQRHTAEFFAYRFDNEERGTIEERWIQPAEALDYLTDRGEAEVLLWPGSWKKL